MEVYIFGMEMSQRIHFLHQMLLKMMIFWENGKKISILVKKFLDSLQKTILSLKCRNCLRIMLKQSQGGFSHFFDLDLIFENVDQICQKSQFLQKNQFFLVKIS